MTNFLTFYKPCLRWLRLHLDSGATSASAPTPTPSSLFTLFLLFLSLNSIESVCEKVLF